VKKSGFVFLFSVMLSGSVAVAKAQGVDVGAEFVSSYIWRGQHLGGISVQPWLEYSKGGFTIGTWSSVDLQDRDNTELDLYAGFGISNFKLTFTDYSFDWTNTPYFEDWMSNHCGEIILEYDFSDFVPITFTWGTFVYNDVDFSSYAELAWSFRTGETDCTLSAGITPWAGYYADKFSLVNVAFKVSKNILIGNFTLPVYGSLVFNPVKADFPRLFNQDGAWLVFGLSL